MIMKTSTQKTVRRQQGFSLMELLISMAVMLIVLGTVFSFISVATRRSQAEQTQMDLTQEAREFVDEFERDMHEVGYPGCRQFAGVNGGQSCSTYPLVPLPGGPYRRSFLASGLVSVSSYQVVFEGDVDGDGVVDTVRYQLVDSANNYPPTGTCPCTIQRSQMPKQDNTEPLGQPTNFSQELQNVVNSGNPSGGAIYGNGLPIAGNTAWGQSNTSYYAAVSTFKDFPVFTAYDQTGQPVALPVTISANGPGTMASIKSVRITINLLANANNGYDQQTRVRPVMTLVGDGRIANCPVAPIYPCN
jgi:prepilin-type N-terminal cleavage/methylation domain-containing protein